jgi:Domain of unknown function (DUF4367)
MNDRNEREIEHVEHFVVALSRATVYPETPDLAAGFWSRLEASRARQRLASPLSLAGVALAAALVTAFALIGNVTPARDAAADFFDRIGISETNEPLTGLPTEVRGEETTLNEAELALGRRIAQPTYPQGLVLDRVIHQDFEPVQAAALYYEKPNGEQFVLFVVNGLVSKGLPIDSDLSDAEEVEWPGVVEGYWLTGPRRVEYRDPEGNVIPESARQTGENTLLWQHDNLVYRLEGPLDKDEAILIAQSLE